MSKDKREQVFQACQELLEEEKSVTVRAVIDRVGGSSRDISPIVKEFKEKLEAESSIAVSEKAEVNTSNSNEEDFIDTNPVTANLERVDKEAQLIAARKIVATAYYEKTQQFNLPGLQEEVNQALSEVDAIAHSQDKTLSPKGMLNWLKGRQKQPQY
ncbi:MAG: DNA-binding protein [Cyanobacteria bacterium J06638_38]